MTSAVLTRGELGRKKLKFSQNISYTVVGDDGNPEFLLLPLTPEFLELAEDYEIQMNKDFLSTEGKKSLESRMSTFSI